MNIREWYEEDYDCSPVEPEFKIFYYQSPRRIEGPRILVQLADEMSIPLKELGKKLKAIGKALGIAPPAPLKFDPRVPTRPPHSMTPARNTVFDRRGRKRY